jgi:CheY-like chemotaxis protein
MTVSRSRPSQPPRASPRLLAGITILLVEDDAEVRRIGDAMLREQGAEILLARDGLEALQLLGAASPDVALVDLLMPHLDGFGLAKRLRADPRWGRLPIIAVTALAAQADYLRTWELDFAAHLTKPVDYGALAATVLRVLGRSGRSWQRDVTRAPLAVVFRETETALKDVAGAVGDERVRRVLATAVARTRRAGRSLLGAPVGQEASRDLRRIVRSTLSVIMGWSHILLVRRQSDAEVRAAVAVIDRNARALTRILAGASAPRR